MLKRILAIIALTLALALPALATDVTIAPLTIPDFSLKDPGQSTNVTVTATNASRTVTSSNAFPQAWVGLGGMVVNFGGTRYYVTRVVSRSEITLATAFSGSTGSRTMEVYPFLVAKLSSNIAFKPLGENYVVQSGNYQTGPWFQQYAASIITDTVNDRAVQRLWLPQMIVPATVDATTGNDATYTLSFHRLSGGLIPNPGAIYQCGTTNQYRLPAVTPTTWGAICDYNAAPPVRLPETYYTARQIDDRFKPCNANQLIYAAATGNRYDCLTPRNGLTITGNYLDATAATPGSGARQAINVKLDYGCAGDGTTDDTTCVNNAFVAAQSTGKPLYFTSGTYLTDTITHNLNGVTILGDGPRDSIIKGRNANQPVFNVTATNGAVNFLMRDIGVEGQGPSSGSSGHCIVINDSSSGLAQSTLQNVYVSNCGGKGVYIPTMFNVLLEGVVVDNVGGNGFELHGSNTTTLIRTYVKTLAGAGTAAYRIYAGTPTLIGANGIDGCTGGNCDWGVFGRTVVDDGTESYVRLNCTNCNIEDFKRYGARFKYYSSGNFFNTSFYAPTSGTVTALKFDYVDDTIQGIFDGQSSIVTQGASWTNSYPIHANANPFHTFSIKSSPYDSFWNGTDAQKMPAWGYQFASGISRYLSRSTGLAADLFQVGTSGLPSGYQSFFKSTATSNIGLGIAQITSQTAPPFVIENDSASPIFRVTTTGALQTNVSGGLAFTVQDTSGNALFRAARANRWADNVGSSFAQLGGSGESGWISGLNAATLPRLGVTATKTQITDTDTGSAPVPGSNLLGLYKTTSSNAALEIKTSNVQSGNAITYNDSVSDRFTVDANGYVTTRRLRLTPVAGDPSSPSNGDVAYNSSSGKFRCYEAGAWTDCISAGGGGGGSVTSVALAAGTSGTDVNISGSPITSSGTITLNIPDASATARGLVTTGTQTFAGAKTFDSSLTTRSISPAVADMYTLGTSLLPWLEVHVTGSSLVVHGDLTNTKKVTYGYSGSTGTIKADASSSIQLTTGSNSGLTINTSGNATFGGTVAAASFSGSGASLTGMSASQLTSGTAGLTVGGTGVTAWAANEILVGTGTNTAALKTMPSCSDATTSKLLYNNSTQSFTCGTDQGGGGGGGITSLNSLNGSSQTFGNDTNVTMVSSGTTHTLTWAGTLAAARGGTGLDTSGSTGVLRVSGGTWSANAGISHLAASTSSDLRGVLSDETGSGAAVFGTSPTISGATISGGTATALTGLGIRSTGTGAFDLTLANTENLNAGRTLTIKVNDAARTLDLGGNLTLTSSFTTSGSNALTLTTTGGTNVTLPTTGTLSTLSGAESLTNKKLGSLTSNGLVTTSGGDGTLSVTVPGSGVLTFLATPSSTNLISAVSDETGTGALVFANTPTLVTPVLGVASATSINKVAITAPATGATLTLADGSTLATSGGHSLTFTTTNTTSVTLPTGGTLATLAGSESLTNKKLGSLTSNGLVTTSGSDGTLSVTVPGSNVLTFLGTPSSANLASALSDETGSGLAVFGTQPSLTRPLIISTTYASLPVAGTSDRVVVVTDCANTACSSGGGSTVRMMRDNGSSWAVLGDGDSGGTPAFSSITAGTNAAALVIGSGGSLGVSGTGTIAATSVTGLSVTAGKTLTVSNSLTFSGTDSSSVAFGGGGTVVYTSGAQTLDAKTLTATVNATFANGGGVRSATSDTNTLNIAAYDVDGAAYQNMIQLVAGNTPVMKFTLGSDATGDMFYRNSSGNVTRLPIGSSNYVMIVAGGIPTWSSNLPAISGGSLLTGGQIFHAGSGGALEAYAGLAYNSSTNTLNVGDSAADGKLKLSETDGDSISLVIPLTVTGARTITLPDATGNVVLDSATQTLTNKTLTSPIISAISNSGTLTLPTSSDTLVGRATTDTLTNKTFDAEGTGNTLTTTSKIWLEAAANNAGVAAANWDLPSADAPAAAAITGTNVLQGVLDFADGSTDLTAQRTLLLPGDWTGAIDAKFKWLSSTTSGSVIWGIATSCVADAETNDPSFNSYSEVTDTTKGTTNQTNDASVTGVTATGCAAGELLHVKIARRLSQAGDTMAGTARLIGLELTLRRAM